MRHKVWRKIMVVLLIVLLLVPTVLTAVADNSGLCFTATNDTLLDLNSKTEFVNSVSYIPASVFSAFGVSYNYIESKSTAMLYTINKQVFFDFSNGNTYDNFLNYYSASATYKNGQVYLPLDWVCNYFGLYYSYVSGNGHGDIIRIKNGMEVLTDSQFLEATSTLMIKYTNDYYGVVQSPSPLSSSSPSDDSNINTKSASISICFIGIPSSDFLDSLDNFAAKVCFFVTADEVAESPDIVRRICGSGHSIGIYCTTSPDSDCTETTDMIFEAAQIRPVLITSPSALEQSSDAFGKENGFAFFKPEIEIYDTIKNSTSIASKLEDLSGYTSILIPLTENTESYINNILWYMSNENINILPLLETMA